MASNVQSYSRHVNGKLVNVRAYQQSDGGGAVPSTDMTIMAGVFDRPPLTAKPGIYTHGLVPIALFPNSRDLPFAPTQLWVRKTDPMQGLGGIGLSSLPEESFVSLTGNAAQEWVAAVREGLDHVRLVISNNPGKSMTDILIRPDVQDALRSAGVDGAEATTEVVEQIWQEASAPPNSPYLASILSDIDSNGASFASRMSNALVTADRSKVEAVVLKDRLRASAAQAVAETRAKAEHAISVYKMAGIGWLKWKANYVNNTPCSTCDSLNGSVVKLGDPFLPNIKKIKVYFDLTTPPVHPNCGCRLVPAKEPK